METDKQTNGCLKFLPIYQERVQYKTGHDTYGECCQLVIGCLCEDVAVIGSVVNVDRLSDAPRELSTAAVSFILSVLVLLKHGKMFLKKIKIIL